MAKTCASRPDCRRAAQELVRLIPEQHFTQPPPRYGSFAGADAGRVRHWPALHLCADPLHHSGARLCHARGKRLEPTETGMLVNDLLVSHFPEIVDLNFTARMEEDLDEVAEGDREWVDVCAGFTLPLRRRWSAPRRNAGHQGRTGKGWPPCPDCGSDLVIRWGRYGKFISCSSFPTCRYTEAWLEKIGVKCPEDGGEVVERKTRKGRVFYGCANYPTCQFTSWKRPHRHTLPELRRHAGDRQ
jgi:DNA topoisomerase I